MRTRLLSTVLLLLAVCLISGCGGRKQVKGKIVSGGQPVTVSEKGRIILSFVSEGGSDTTVYNADTKNDGTFTIIGPENKGIPPGKYKVQVQALDPYSSSGGTDKFGGKYAPGKSTLVVDVGSGELTIDVGK